MRNVFLECLLFCETRITFHISFASLFSFYLAQLPGFEAIQTHLWAPLRQHILPRGFVQLWRHVLSSFFPVFFAADDAGICICFIFTHNISLYFPTSQLSPRSHSMTTSQSSFTKLVVHAFAFCRAVKE